MDNREDVLTLTTSDGQDVDFMEIAEIYIDEELYLILQPVELFEDMDEDDAFVFHSSIDLKGEERLDLVYDDELSERVFEEYRKLLNEQYS